MRVEQSFTAHRMGRGALRAACKTWRGVEGPLATSRSDGTGDLLCLVQATGIAGKSHRAEG